CCRLSQSTLNYHSPFTIYHSLFRDFQVAALKHVARLVGLGDGRGGVLAEDDFGEELIRERAALGDARTLVEHDEADLAVLLRVDDAAEARHAAVVVDERAGLGDDRAFERRPDQPAPH